MGEFCLLAGLYCLLTIAQSELAPPTSIPSQKNTPQSYLHTNFMEAFTQLKLSLQPGIVVNALIPAIGRQKERDLCDLKASLVFIVSFRTDSQRYIMRP